MGANTYGQTERKCKERKGETEQRVRGKEQQKQKRGDVLLG
jgi:hypothetical protein